MTVDRNNRSHKPKGTPEGGRYEAKNTGAGADDVAAPTPVTDDGHARFVSLMEGHYGRLLELEERDVRHRTTRQWAAAFDRWRVLTCFQLSFIDRSSCFITGCLCQSFLNDQLILWYA